MDSVRRCTISKADNQIQDLCNQQLGRVSRWNDLQSNRSNFRRGEQLRWIFSSIESLIVEIVEGGRVSCLGIMRCHVPSPENSTVHELLHQDVFVMYFHASVNHISLFL